MRVLLPIAIKHLITRKRQSFVSILGIILGVSFFLAISSLMRGSEQDFVRRLIDNTPHLTIVDEFREPRTQPLRSHYPQVSAIEISGIKPVREPRGIRTFEKILKFLREQPNTLASPVLTNQAVVTYAGREQGITLYGMVPEEMEEISTIRNYITKGSINALIGNPDGILIGTELARILSLELNDKISVLSSIGESRTFTIVGMFRTGRADFDEHQTFIQINRAQAMFNKANRVNNIIVKVGEAPSARELAERVETKFGYKSISWQEASEDILSALVIRNIIMYTVVSAVLVVAAFGIFNVISTIVMEKQKDIAILKSIGFHARDIERIFTLQGLLLGIFGCLFGVPLGIAIMWSLMQIEFKPPGATEVISMPVSWEWFQFVISIMFALLASLSAALIPARKASKLEPVQILRGAQ